MKKLEDILSPGAVESSARLFGIHRSSDSSWNSFIEPGTSVVVADDSPQDWDKKFDIGYRYVGDKWPYFEGYRVGAGDRGKILWVEVEPSPYSQDARTIRRFVVQFGDAVVLAGGQMTTWLRPHAGHPWWKQFEGLGRGRGSHRYGG